MKKPPKKNAGSSVTKKHIPNSDSAVVESIFNAYPGPVKAKLKARCAG